MEEDRNLVSVTGNILLDVLLPYRVYEDCGMSTPEGDPLLTLEAGFREMEDAEIYVGIKSKNGNRKYVIKSSTK